MCPCGSSYEYAWEACLYNRTVVMQCIDSVYTDRKRQKNKCVISNFFDKSRIIANIIFYCVLIERKNNQSEHIGCI